MSSSIDSPLQGAYAELKLLLGARFAARDLKLHQRRRALSLLAGPNKSNFRGRGIDFEEVRAYQPGDDIRTIDWRVTARSNGAAYTKQFREERERPALIVVDQRQPMFFGSQTCFKSVLAAYVGSLLLWSSLANGDRVGGMVIGNDGDHDIRPKRSRQSALSLIHALLDANHGLNRTSGIGLDSAESATRALSELRRIVRPGSALYLISDFAGFNSESAQEQLFQLSRHAEITALQTIDPLEQELNLGRQIAISDGLTTEVVDGTRAQTRQRYRNRYQLRQQTLKQNFGRLGAPLLQLRTDQPPLTELLKFYGTRRGRR